MPPNIVAIQRPAGPGRQRSAGPGRRRTMGCAKGAATPMGGVREGGCADTFPEVGWAVPTTSGVQGPAPALAGGASVQGTVQSTLFVRIILRLLPDTEIHIAVVASPGILASGHLVRQIDLRLVARRLGRGSVRHPHDRAGVLARPPAIQRLRIDRPAHHPLHTPARRGPFGIRNQFSALAEGRHRRTRRPRGSGRHRPGHPRQCRPAHLLPIPPDTKSGVAVLLPKLLPDPAELFPVVRFQQHHQERVGVPGLVADDLPAVDLRNLHTVDRPAAGLLFQLPRHIALHHRERFAIGLGALEGAVVKFPGASGLRSGGLHQAGGPVRHQEIRLSFCQWSFHGFTYPSARLPQASGATSVRRSIAQTASLPPNSPSARREPATETPVTTAAVVLSVVVSWFQNSIGSPPPGERRDVSPPVSSPLTLFSSFMPAGHPLPNASPQRPPRSSGTLVTTAAETLSGDSPPGGRPGAGRSVSPSARPVCPPDRSGPRSR